MSNNRKRLSIIIKYYRIFIILLATFSILLPQEVPLNNVLTIKISNSKMYNNPYDFSEIELSAIVRSPSNKEYKIIGYYNADGKGGKSGNQWEIKIRPNEIGTWTYNYYWSDNSEGGEGVFNCINSDVSALEIYKDKFRLKGNNLIPLIIPTREFIHDNDYDSVHEEFYSWAKNVTGAKFIGTTLVYFDISNTRAYYKNNEEKWIFNTEFWNRLNNHFDELTKKGLGIYLLIFSDDDNNPTVNGVLPYSKEETNLFKYVLARYSAYPKVLFDSGIDIGEYRTNEWIEYFINWFHENDPYRNPVSSRFGGGSGGINSYNSDYESNGEEYYPDIKKLHSPKSKPVIFTDRWRENYSRPEQNYWNKKTLPQVIWELSLLNGFGAYVSGNENYGYLDSNYKDDFESAPTIGSIIYFFEKIVKNYNTLNSSFAIDGDTKLVAYNNEEIITSFYKRQKINLNLKFIHGYYWYYTYNYEDRNYQRVGKITASENVTILNPDISKENVVHLIKADNYKLKLLYHPTEIYEDESIKLTLGKNDLVETIDIFILSINDTVKKIIDTSFNEEINIDERFKNYDSVKVVIKDSKLSSNIVESEYINIKERNKVSLNVVSPFIQEGHKIIFSIIHKSGEKEYKLFYYDNGNENLIQNIKLEREQHTFEWKIPVITDNKIYFYLRDRNNEVISKTDSFTVYDMYSFFDFTLNTNDSTKIELFWNVENEYLNKGYILKKKIGNELDKIWTYSEYPIFESMNIGEKMEYKFTDYEIEYDINVNYYLYYVTNELDTNLLDSTFYKIKLTSIRDTHFEKFGISIFPIPAKNFLKAQLTIDKNLPVKFILYNSIGSKIFYRNYNFRKGENSIKLNLLNYSSGIYFLKVHAPEHNEILKFIILR